MTIDADPIATEIAHNLRHVFVPVWCVENIRLGLDGSEAFKRYAFSSRGWGHEPRIDNRTALARQFRGER